MLAAPHGPFSLSFPGKEFIQRWEFSLLIHILSGLSNKVQVKFPEIDSLILPEERRDLAFGLWWPAFFPLSSVQCFEIRSGDQLNICSVYEQSKPVSIRFTFPLLTDLQILVLVTFG